MLTYAGGRAISSVEQVHEIHNQSAGAVWTRSGRLLPPNHHKSTAQPQQPQQPFKARAAPKPSATAAHVAHMAAVAEAAAEGTEEDAYIACILRKTNI